MAAHDDIPDEDFDRLWDEAFNEAAGKQCSNPRHQADPIEQTAPRRASSARRPSNHFVSPKQEVPQNQQRQERRSSLAAIPPQAATPLKVAGQQARPTRRLSSIPRGPKPKQASPIRAGEPHLSAYTVPVMDQLLRKNTTASVSGASIVSNFSVLDISVANGWQDGLPGCEYDGAILTSESDNEAQNHPKTEGPLPGEGNIALKTSKSTSSIKSIKWNSKIGAAKFVLELEPSSSEFEREGNNGHGHSSVHPYTLPTTFKVSAHKEKRKQPSGLVLSHNQRNEAHTVMVKDIGSESIFCNTALRIGQEILTINQHRVKNPQQAAKIMKSIKGSVDLLVSAGGRPPGTKYVRIKTNPNRKNGNGEIFVNEGLGIQLQNRKGLVQATYIDSDGLFSTSTIRQGDILLNVNGMIVGDESRAMKALLVSQKQDLIYSLVYSMEDLRVGLMGQLLPRPWEKTWSEDYREVTLSRFLSDDEYDRRQIFVVLSFQQDWTCRCTDPIDALLKDATLDERAHWQLIIMSEIEPLLDRINEALELAVAKLSEATREAMAVAALDAKPTETQR